MSSKSQYDPSRDTVGKIYRDAQMQNSHEDAIEIGDMGRELTRDLVDDINDALEEFDKKEKPYYLMVHEKKDLQMKSALARRMIYFGYRPWPEDDTIVFWKDPKVQELRFCWALPHWSEMDLILMNEDQFDKSFISQIKAWREVNLRPFGFQFHKELRWIPDPTWEDEPIKKYGK
jgi:hypothetical protein